jgi:hypothetical protein
MEVVGLILGALPVLMLSFEQFQQKLSVVKSYRSLQLEIRQIENEVRLELLILQHTLQVLLSGTISDSKIGELLSYPRSTLWKSREVESALVESLGSASYSLLVQVFSQLFEAISILEKSLQSIARASRDGSLNLRVRLKWTLSEDKRRKRLEEVRKQTKHIRNIVRVSVSSQTFEKKQAIENISTSLGKVLELQKLAEDVETLTHEASEYAWDSKDDNISIYTVDSEVFMQSGSILIV